MKKRWLAFLLVGFSVIGIVAAACSPGTSQNVIPASNNTGTVNGSGTSNQLSYPVGSSQQTGIYVNGQGKVTAVPDVAIISLGVEAQALTVGDARQQAANAMDAIMKALANNGVATKDIQTQGFSIYPVKTWNKEGNQEILIGYRVTNTVTVKVRNIDNAGKIIDDTAKAGGDLTRFNNIYMTLDKPETYYNQARENAINDAMAKAQQMATLTKVTLGKPVYIAETSNNYPMPIYKAVPSAGMAADREASTPITPGETEISISVQIVFAIQ